jgi:P pilus assembly chaperone PapD
VCFLFVSFFLVSPDAPAFVLIPITMDFDPAGQGTPRTFRVQNESDTPVAVQGSMVTGKLDIHGNETHEMVVFLHNRGTAHAVSITAKMKLNAAAPP